MATKIKAPPKKAAADVLTLLKLDKGRDTSGYVSKMGNLLSFLHVTSDIRIGAEVVERDLNIEHSGRLVSFKRMREDFINEKMRAVKFHEKEEDELEVTIREIHKEVFELGKITRSKAKVNTDAKKEKAQKSIDELQVTKEGVKSELNELRQKIKGLLNEERKKMEAVEYPVETMREKLELMGGCKIRVDLQTGSYTFPVPVGVPFYNEVCNLVGLPVEQKVVEKPKVVRMFTMPSEVLGALKSASKFTSTDTLRPAMTCVLLEIRDNMMTVVGTDAYRLFKSQSFEVSGPSGSFDYLIPRAALKRLPKTQEGSFFFYESKDGRVSFLGITATLLDARFPDWKCVMPKYESYMEFEREDFMEKVCQVLPYANKSTAQVTFHINGDIQMTAQDVDFSFESIARMRYLTKNIPDTDIAFNGKFLKESLSIFKEDSIKFYSEGNNTRAGIFTNDVDTVLLMPLMQGY